MTPSAHPPLLIQRRFAIQLLHEAQIAGAQGFIAAVGAATSPDAYFIAPAGSEVAALIADADAHFASTRRSLWAIYLHRPGAPTAPALEDFALRPATLRLSASLATKGVLQLRAWVLDGGRVVECALRIED